MWILSRYWKSPRFVDLLSSYFDLKWYLSSLILFHYKISSIFVSSSYSSNLYPRHNGCPTPFFPWKLFSSTLKLTESHVADAALIHSFCSYFSPSTSHSMSSREGIVSDSSNGWNGTKDRVNMGTIDSRGQFQCSVCFMYLSPVFKHPNQATLLFSGRLSVTSATTIRDVRRLRSRWTTKVNNLLQFSISSSRFKKCILLGFKRGRANPLWGVETTIVLGFWFPQAPSSLVTQVLTTYLCNMSVRNMT